MLRSVTCVELAFHERDWVDEKVCLIKGPTFLSLPA